MPEQYEHLMLNDVAESNNFRSPRNSFSTELRLPLRDRPSHAQRLLAEMSDALASDGQRKEVLRARGVAARNGTYLEFTSKAGFDLVSKSLEDQKSGIRLLNLRQLESWDGEKQIRATVYVPAGKEAVFIKKISNYEAKDTHKWRPQNANLVEWIEDIGSAFLEAFWTDEKTPVGVDMEWCELWLNVDDQNSYTVNTEIPAFLALLSELGIEQKKGIVLFPDRAVLVAKINKEKFLELLLRTDLLAEIRSASKIAQYPSIVSMWRSESSLLIDELIANRLEFNNQYEAYACILDSGVNNWHPLLKPILPDSNVLTVDGSWRTDDHAPGSGHGTLMAGIVAYGDLEEVMRENWPVKVEYGLCSVKAIPPREQTPEENWGHVTSQAISRAEIANPGKKWNFCLAITAPEWTSRWRPSSWSGSIDNLAYNEWDWRVLLLAAGNTWIAHLDPPHNYPYRSDVSSVENPWQSWNAITVGAYTNKIFPESGIIRALAPKWGISPHSTTSIVWDSKWPIKPDVVFEWWNLHVDDHSGSLLHSPDLALLSTSKNFQARYFDSFSETSLAVSEATRFASTLHARYPHYRPETIRGLMVHSAEWTESMFRQFSLNRSRKADVAMVMRRFGYWIPSIEKALYSSDWAFSAIIEDEIQPFKKEGSDVKLNEMHFFNLPWPVEELLELGNIPVRLRATLSYFIEPSPGEIGWKDRYRYPSHWLRFRINRPSESQKEFMERVNLDARNEEEEYLWAINESDGWIIGSRNREHGSIQSDFLECKAYELASRNMFAVFPITWWWKERKNKKKFWTKVKYSLILSLETWQEEVSLYQAVKAKIQIPVEIEIWQ